MPEPRDLINEEIEKVLKDPFYAIQSSDYELSNRERVGLAALHFVLYKPPATENEIKISQMVLENILGDIEFNENIKNILRYGSSGFSTSLLRSLLDLSYRTRHYGKIDLFSRKIDALIDPILEDKPIDPEKRFTLPEFGLVYDLAKIMPFLDELRDSKLLDGNLILTRLYEISEKSSKIYNQLENNYLRSMINIPGSFALDDLEKKSKLRGFTLECLDHLMKTFITSHGHAARLFSTFDPQAKKQKIQISHINPEYQVESFDLLAFLYSDIYKLELDKLIDDKGKKYLKKTLGEHWLNEINRLFKLAERKLHDDSLLRLAGIGTPPGKEMQKAGVKSLLGKYIGHTQLSKIDFEKIYEKMYGNFYAKESIGILCSEFVAQSLIAAIVEVNKKLGKDIIQIPFSPYENLSTMTPDRLLAALKEKNCVRHFKESSTVFKYIKPGNAE